ncbi:MAG TPA: FimV/HubP family polar landmark protein, partial [Woeseiaceae bacterium]|nr:FimV/HubP family polar landmark protein [Woeseiaceae bacterium]
MLGRLAGATLILLLAWSGTAQALGLGDIRLESALNEPFRAEIDLLSVTPEELEGLAVRLAPAETFRRYGIERPPFLSGFRFEIRALPGDRGLVRITSREPVTEPFVTFLAEATWPRGRLLREYTVLLDPPTFAGDQSDAGQPAPARAPAAAPARSGPDAGSIRRAPEPRQAAPALGAGDRYRVQRNETLWGIAQRLRPPGSGLTMNQVMMALYENNPEAFDGNINRLREGAVLQVPSEDAMYGINRSDAVAEVSRQNQAWQGDESAGSLRLVPPDEAPGAAATPAAGAGGAAAPGTDPAAAERVRRLEAELAERERQLAIRDRELAELQQQLAAGEETAETPPAATEEEPAAATPGVDLEAEGEAAAEEGEIFAETGPADAEEAAEPAPGAGAPTAAQEPAAEEEAPARTSPAVVAAQPEEDGGIMGLVGGLLGSIWTYVGLGVVVIALLLLVLARRRGGEAEDSTGTWEALDDEFEDDDEREATARLRALASEEDSILVVEKEEEPTDTGAATAAGAGAAAAAAGEPRDTAASGVYSLEDTFSSETAINLDQSDPLAEADFHMAYGLYDQAADLIRNAIAADPDRTDLKAKLAEVYFVWGNKDAFVDAAENLHDALGHGGGKDGDWDKIVIMGQQIAPEHEL